MWEKVKELTTEERKEWLNVVNPCTGQIIDFRGVHVMDVHVAEALTYMVEEHP
jgi:hypothetical protein